MPTGKLKGKRLWLLSVGIWIALTVILSAAAPGAKEFVQANKDAGLPADAESIIADRQVEKYFPHEGGLPLFAVFHKEKGLTEEEILKYAKAIESIEMKDIETIPLTQLKAGTTSKLLVGK